MKDTRPIEVQVAELTTEQRRTIGKLFRISLIFLIIVLVLCSVLIVNVVFKYTAWMEAQEELDEYYESLEKILDPEIEEAEEARDEAYHAVQSALFLLTLSSGVLFVVGLVFLIWQKKVHPYYSEKKYKYLRKHSLL